MWNKKKIARYEKEKPKLQKNTEICEIKKINKRIVKALKNLINIKDFQRFWLRNETKVMILFIFLGKTEYESTVLEHWIMCSLCKICAHENCTNGQSKFADYKCDLCCWY